MFQKRSKQIRLVTVCTLIYMIAGDTIAASTNGECDRVALLAAQRTGVPVELLYAITRVETGRRIDAINTPWPWAINVQGQGRWFDTAEVAKEFAALKTSSGIKNIDVGCFQLNYRWHGKAFQSITHMFEPEPNAMYAARFLNELYLESGDWLEAAAAYHSRTPKYAKKYRNRIIAALKEIPKDRALPKIPKQRLNRFPLLKPEGNKPQLGSLVPHISPPTSHWFEG